MSNFLILEKIIAVILWPDCFQNYENYLTTADVLLLIISCNFYI